MAVTAMSGAMPQAEFGLTQSADVAVVSEPLERKVPHGRIGMVTRRTAPATATGRQRYAERRAGMLYGLTSAASQPPPTATSAASRRSGLPPVKPSAIG